MAQKRMFDKTITNSDEFIEMPLSSQVLYFHLSMNADDDGFINSWKSIMRMTGTKEDDLKVLIAKQFIIPFDSGVIVIKHWRINNFLRKDRHVDTKFKKELSMLETNNNQEYVWLTNGQPSIDKNSIDKNIIKKEIYKERKNPTLEEIEQYCKERNNNIDAQKFYDYYEINNWKDKDGKKIKNWKQKMITWEGRSKKENKDIPSWFGKEIKSEQLSQEEENELKEMLKGFE